jgi:hypothetical protein
MGSSPILSGVRVVLLGVGVFFLRPVSCVPNVTSVSGLSILDIHINNKSSTKLK